MGNLRDKCTDEEWDKIADRITTDKKNGKPEQEYMSIALHNKTLDELKRLKIILGEVYDGYQLNNINNWIFWKSI